MVLIALPPTVIYALFATALVSATNFTQCLIEIKAGKWGQVGGTDNNGTLVANISEATAITYDLCVRACGTDPQPFDWSAFSQQFSAWLLPWLALVSNLPFGASLRQDNILSVLLVVGSPTLAAYSLALTVLNGQWIATRFRGIRYPNSRHAVQVLQNLQHVPLKIVTEDCLLASLVVLPENNHWWKDLFERLDYSYTWSIASATSIIWVVVAYLFTLIDSFTNISVNSLNSSGQGVGSLWLWLLPIVAAWLLTSPKSDSDRVTHALRRANKIALVATPSGIFKVCERYRKFGFSLRSHHHKAVFRDQERSPPVFNYARFLSWVEAAEEVHLAFRAASKNADAGVPVNTGLRWSGTVDSDIDPANRSGSAAQIERYCRPKRGTQRGRFCPDIILRVVVASAIALGLQWGTSGSAIVVQWFTPTRGMFFAV